DPVVPHARGKAVDQQHGLARALVDEGKPDAIRDESVHANSGLLFPLRSQWGAEKTSHPYHLGGARAIVRANFRIWGFGTHMAASLIPHFANDSGVEKIAIGAKEFQCMGARP